MRVSFSVVILCAAAAGLALPVTGQVARSRMSTVTMGNSMQTARLSYTAEYKITNVKTLVNGSTITRESTETVALDSHGRRMTTTTTVPLSGDQTPKSSVSVFDPVARTNSSWTVPGQKATVVSMPVPGAPQNCAATAPVRIPRDSQTQSERVRPTVEDLGTETIQGVEARGRRMTSTTPAGTVGNDAPLVNTIETWTAIAPGLRGLVARQVVENPLLGKMTKELTNFTQAEPDISVFQPPADYEIVNKPAPGSACISAEGGEPPAAIIPPPPPPEQ
jgi:hypothetical protein